MTNAMFGLFWLLVESQTLLAKPVVLPVTKIGDSDLNAVLPSEKYLLTLLCLNLIYIIWALVKGIWDAKAKREDKTAEKLDALTLMVHEMKGKLNSLNDPPDEDEIAAKIERRVEFLVFKTMRDMKSRD